MNQSSSSSARRSITAFYLSGTHWDREWYRPVAEFRFLLVRLLDRLLDLMEQNPAFRYFHLDGQTCILDDYMSLRPDQRPRLEKLIREGRVLVGPWYTMPDLFCVGDEALIRNLLLGRRISRAWGVEPMPVAFTCDMFGHPSQMPQIYAGFGMHDCVLGRGTNEHTTPPLFWWRAPDGSKVFCFKVQDKQGYGAFAVPRCAMEGPNFMSDQVADVGAALESAAGDPAKLTQVREAKFREKLNDYLSHELKRFDSDVVCLMDWMDHSVPAEDVQTYLRLIRETNTQLEPEHSTLPAFFAAARRSAAATAPTRDGELYEPGKNANPYLYLIANCVSSRVRMKQANDQCQMLLEKWAEPWTFIANREGGDLHHSFLEDAWKQLLLNHAHDSICGCSIDQVHRDMMVRFDHARLMAEQLRHQALGALTAGCRDLARNKDEFTLTLASATPLAERRVVVFDVDLPLDYPAQFVEGFSTHPVKAFMLETAEGAPVPYQRLRITPRTNERSRFAQCCFMSNGPFTRHTVAAEVELPGIGFTSLRVVPSERPVRTVGTLRTGPTAAANEYLAIACESDGTLTLTDKRTGQTYTDLLTLTDRSEIGDGWFHDHAPNDEQVLSSAVPGRISVVDDGPLRVTFAIEQTLSIPARFDRDAQAPSTERVALMVRHEVSLNRGATSVEVRTIIDNRARDHRLQLLLPSDAVGAQTWLAHHPYDLVERPIAIDPQTVDWQEMEQVEKPMLSLQAVGDGTRGLALLSAGGLHEGGVRDDVRRTMQVTLLRAFRQTITTGGEVDGQEQGPIELRYAIMPYAGELPRSLALQELARLQAGVLTRQSGKRPSGHPAMKGQEPATRSFVQQTEGKLILSACKPAEHDPSELIVRLWNPTAVTQSATLRFWRPIASAEWVRLDETPLSNAPQLNVRDQQLDLHAASHAIVTVRVQFQ
jgi:hypothetical protein